MIRRLRIFLGRILFGVLPLQAFPSLNRAVLRFAGYRVGSGVVFFSSAQVLGLVDVEIGSNTFIGHQVLIWGGQSRVTIGNNCDISSRVNLITGSHHLGTPDKRAGYGYCEDIVIGDGTWIGFGVTILAGVTVGKGCIIAAGSLVNKDVPSNTMVAGVPAKILKQLD